MVPVEINTFFFTLQAKGNSEMDHLRHIMKEIDCSLCDTRYQNVHCDTDEHRINARYMSHISVLLSFQFIFFLLISLSYYKGFVHAELLFIDKV